MENTAPEMNAIQQPSLFPVELKTQLSKEVGVAEAERMEDIISKYLVLKAKEFGEYVGNLVAKKIFGENNVK